jgi:hypothetical protein
LREEIPSLLDVASPAAREEWGKLESRLPSTEEIANGFIDLSEETLDEIASKVRRFRDILGASRRPARRADEPASADQARPLAATA